MPDAWRAYLEMALGLTEAPRKKAQQVAGDLVNRGGATATQLQGLVEDLLSAGMANREALNSIVRYEVDRALGVVGLATAEEVAELTTRVRDLEKQLREAQARAAQSPPVTGAATGPSLSPLSGRTPGKVAKKAVAKKAVARKATDPAAEALGAPTTASPTTASPAPASPATVSPAPPAPTMGSAAPAAPVRVSAAPARKATPGKAAAKKAAAARKAPAPVDDVLTETLGEELTAAEREALLAAVSDQAPPAKAAKKAAPTKASPTYAAPTNATPTNAAPTKAGRPGAAKNGPAKNTAAKKAPAKKTAIPPLTTPEA